ncbi:MAG: phage major capsid protein [Kiritimatiellae bacterium]|nr:phage major capsid protein [Kiritimatiellia bacterium]
MTIEEIKILSQDEIESRSSEIRSILDKVISGEDTETNVDELKTELDNLEARSAELREELETRKQDAEAVLNGAGVEVREILPQGETKMSNVETRNSAKYIDAFAEAIKSGDKDFTECRALMTVNVEDGTIPVPTMVEDYVVTAWQKSEIFNRITKIEGVANYEVTFEISGTDAVIHVEGSERPSEEELTLGIVSIIPQNLKKWIEVTDEVLALKGEAFLRYLYAEFAHRIIKAADDAVIALIIAQVGASTATMAGQATIAAEAGKAAVLDAVAELSDEASDIVVIGNRRTRAYMKKQETLNNGDVFDGLPFIVNNSLPSYATAEEGDEYLIVGDLTYGARVTLPNGNEIKYIVDEKSKAPDDRVVITGKLLAGIGLVAPNGFCVVTKPESEGEG